MNAAGMYMERFHAKRERNRIGQSGTGHHMEGEKVLLPRMAVPGRGRVLPLDELSLTLSRRLHHRVGEPHVKLPARLGGFRVAKASHVVIAVAAADEEYVFVSQWRKCAAQRKVFRWVERIEQRDLQDG